MNYLKRVDPQMYRLAKLEEKRQAETLMMIPSENIVSAAVQEAISTSLGNKYAEGYPKRRYYQGQKIVDQVEDLVRERVKKLFEVPAANVQALSGSPANFAVYMALLNPGDTLMGLALSSGGHLTHGAAKTASSKFFRSVPYNVDKKNSLIDYDGLRKLAKKEKPKLIVAGTTAYARFLDWKKFASIADEVGAYLMADIAHVAGLVIAKVYPSPVPYVHVVTTTTHKTLRGPRGAIIMTTHQGIKKDPDLAKKIDQAIIPGTQGGPHLNTIAAIGVALKEASSQRFKSYCLQIIKNAKILSRELIKQNFDLVTHGTDCHLMLIDLRNKQVSGRLVAVACEQAGIVLNYNTIPYDPNPPLYPSGIRLGTPGVTSRGMKEKEMKLIATWLYRLVEDLGKTKQRLGISLIDERDPAKRKLIIREASEIIKINHEVKKLCKRFPIKKIY